MTTATSNKLYPGLPDYTGPSTGFFTLLHHEGPLTEYSHNVQERIRYINSNKPKHEQAIRLRHIVYIPDSMIPEVLRKARSEYYKASSEYDKASSEYDNNNTTVLAYLHLHVSDCKWNGKTLVFTK